MDSGTDGKMKLEEIEALINSSFDIRNYMMLDNHSEEQIDKYNKTKWQWKNAVAKYCQPQHIFEIGVRAGYTAYSFLNGALPKASYLGVDNDSSTHGGKKGYSFKAVKKLKETFPQSSIELEILDTQTGDTNSFKEAHREQFDFLHVDGDHGFDGCLKDLYLVDRLASYGAFILVDDYILCAGVTKATDRFIEDTQYEALQLPTGQGDFLILKSQK